MGVRFRSTNGGAEGWSLGDALLTGQAPDRGLFLPDRIPPLDQRTLLELVGRPYPEVAARVLGPYLDGEVSAAELGEICEQIYDFEVPLERVCGRRYLLRLDRGPTASFKDFAARWMGRMIGRLVKQRGGQGLLILTATSGDTGSAVAHAFHRVEGVACVVLFPVAEVSDRQRKQMTTIGDNVTVIGVEGKFDDCQAMVKRAFADPALGSLRLSSANSINVGRLLPQSVYYVWAWLQLADVAAREPMIVSVPSGNFGDLCGGLLARAAGLPIRRFVVATNSNDEVPRFFASGAYERIEPSRMCISNAMNVGHPSNLARLVDLYGGHMDETGRLLRPPDMERLRRELWAISIDDDATRATIAAVWRAHGVLLEPHGAVAWAALERSLAPAEPDALAISLETAHPAKFPAEVRAATGQEPVSPAALEGLDELPESYEVIAADYPGFKARLLRDHGS